MIRAEYVFEKTKDEETDKERRISYVQRMLLSCANLLEKNKKYTLEIKNAPLTFKDIDKIENEHLESVESIIFVGNYATLRKLRLLYKSVTRKL